jgi:hypothetical protein
MILIAARASTELFIVTTEQEFFLTELRPELVFLNVYGALESISRNEFRQLM